MNDGCVNRLLDADGQLLCNYMSTVANCRPGIDFVVWCFTMEILQQLVTTPRLRCVASSGSAAATCASKSGASFSSLILSVLMHAREGKQAELILSSVDLRVCQVQSSANVL